MSATSQEPRVVCPEPPAVEAALPAPKEGDAHDRCATAVGAATARLAGEVEISTKRVKEQASELARLRAELKERVAAADRSQQELERTRRQSHLWHAQPPVQRSASDARWAFITMAHGSVGDESYLWSAIALARQLQLLSRFPLLLLTDIKRFPDGTKVERLRDLHVKVLPLEHLAPPRQDLKHSRWIVAWWKIQIWKLTDYEKLIWLDSDALVYRSIDYLFERPWMVSQRDDYHCKFDQEDAKICSGIMLLRPNMSDFYGLRDYAASAGVSLDRGDQGVIETYFKRTSRPIGLLTDLEAAFGRCISKIRTAYVESDRSPVDGVWSVPSFVHKSGGWSYDNNEYTNVCFQPNVSMQLYTVGDRLINVCHFNPLAATWRSSFCEALSLLNVTVASARAYCSDDCWHRGHELKGVDVQCGPVSSTIPAKAYEKNSPGMPWVEVYEELM